MRFVDGEGFADDVCDGHAGVHGAAGILKDNLDAFAEETHGAGRGGEKVVSFKVSGAGDVGSFGEEAEEGASHGGLAATRLADEGEHGGGVKIEADALDDGDGGGFGEEALALGESDVKITDGEEWGGCGMEWSVGHDGGASLLRGQHRHQHHQNWERRGRVRMSGVCGLDGVAGDEVAIARGVR